MDRRSLLLGAAVIGAGAGVTAQAAQAQDRGQLLEALVKLEIQSWQDTKDRNIAAMRAYLADEAITIFNDGRLLAKGPFLELIKQLRIDNFSVSQPMLLPVGPDVATLVYRCTYASAMKTDKAVTTTVTSSNCYVRRGGKWLSLLYQETQIKA